MKGVAKMDQGHRWVMRALGLLALATAPSMLVGVGCGGYKPPTLGACGDGVPRDEQPCGSDGYVAADRCFKSAAAACDCLGCTADACVQLETAPVQVRCGTSD
jgi:hypothetical protein